MGVRMTGGLVSITVAATSTVLFTPHPGRVIRYVVRKVFWYNNTLANALLRLGYDNPAAVFVPCLPNIATIAGFDGQLGETEIPIFGNAPEGFAPDTTAVTGTAGVLMAQVPVLAAGNILVEVEVEIME